MDERVVVSSTPSGGATTTRRFVYDPDGRVIGEYGTSATNVIAERIWMTPEISDGGAFGGDDGTGGYAPIAIVIGSTLRWVHSNHLGVPATYTSNTGAAIATPAYTLPGFPGQFQTLSDLYYNKYRDYDTSTGRYIQGDPIGLNGDVNPYLYALGNPVRYTDPKGLWTINLGLAINVNIPGSGLFGGAFTGFGGIAFDGCNWGIYRGIGVGGGVGAGASAGIQLGGSNAKTIYDLRGLFYSAAGSGGEGLVGGLEGYSGSGSDGSPIVGGNGFVGLGAGASGMGGGTYTWVN